MKYYLILFLLCFPVQAEYYIGVGIGKNDILFGDQEWQDNGEVGCAFRAGYRHHIASSFYGDIGYSHYSQCMTGAGVDDKFEDSLDSVYYWVEYRF